MSKTEYTRRGILELTGRLSLAIGGGFAVAKLLPGCGEVRDDRLDAGGPDASSPDASSY